MKTLSFQQPWASLVAMGIKDVENRTWNTGHRGKFLIHASSKKVTKGFVDELPLEWSAEIMLHIDLGNLPELNTLPTSAIVGCAEIEDAVDDSQSIWASPGCLHWRIKNAYLFDEPITGVKGKLHFFDYPLDEDNLPKAHKVEFRLPTLNKGVLTFPCTDSFIDERKDQKEIWFEIGSKLFAVFNQDFVLKEIKKLHLVGQSKNVILDVEKAAICKPLDDDGNAIRLPSLVSEDEDYCGEWQVLSLVIKK